MLSFTISESRHCHRSIDDYADTTTSCRFHQALHADGHQYYDQETRQGEARGVLVHVPAGQHRVALRHDSLHGRQSGAIPRRSLESV